MLIQYGSTRIMVERDDDGYMVTFTKDGQECVQHYDPDGEPSPCDDARVDAVPMDGLSAAALQNIVLAYNDAQNNRGSYYAMPFNLHRNNAQLLNAMSHLAVIANRLTSEHESCPGASVNSSSVVNQLSILMRAMNVFGPSVVTAYENGVSINMFKDMLDIISSSTDNGMKTLRWIYWLLDMPYEYAPGSGDGQLVESFSMDDLLKFTPCFNPDALAEMVGGETIIDWGSPCESHPNHRYLDSHCIKILVALEHDGTNLLTDLPNYPIAHKNTGTTKTQMSSLVHDVIHDANPNENRILRRILEVLSRPCGVIIDPKNLTVEWVREQARLPYQVFEESLVNNEYAAGSTASINDLYVMLVDKAYNALTDDEKHELYRGMPDTLMDSLMESDSVQGILQVLTNGTFTADDVIDSIFTGMGYKAPLQYDYTRVVSDVILDAGGMHVEKSCMKALSLLAYALGTNQYHGESLGMPPLHHEIADEEQSRVYALSLLINHAMLSLGTPTMLPDNEHDYTSDTIMCSAPLVDMYTWQAGEAEIETMTPRQAEKRTDTMIAINELNDDEYAMLRQARVPVFNYPRTSNRLITPLHWFMNITGTIVEPEELGATNVIMFPATLGRLEDLLTTAISNKHKGGIQRLANLSNAELDYDTPEGKTYPFSMTKAVGTHAIIPENPSLMYQHTKYYPHTTEPNDYRNEWQTDAWKKRTSLESYSIIELMNHYRQTNADPAAAMVITTDDTTDTDAMLSPMNMKTIGMTTFNERSTNNHATTEEKTYIRTGKSFHGITTKLHCTIRSKGTTRTTVNLFPDANTISTYQHRPTCSQGEPLSPAIGTITLGAWNGTDPTITKRIADTSAHKRAQWDALLAK